MSDVLYKLPTGFVYKFLRVVQGPLSASGDVRDLDTDSDPTPTLARYTVPDGSDLRLARINFIIADASIGTLEFGGLSQLTNGCLFRILDETESVIFDFFDGLPIVSNCDFSNLAGVDSLPATVAGVDGLPIRFTISRAGYHMRLKSGWSLEWVNQDDISGLNRFRIMVQGVLVTRSRLRG